MGKIKAFLIFGTRPEAIKLAPVIEALKNEKNFSVEVLATAQHREMLDQVLEIFDIKPDYDLNIMIENQNLSDVTNKCLNGVDKILKKERPDIVLVQGDTTTVFASALACYYNKIPVGHVEAGLRTSDKYSPFPEEINRRIATVLSELHFAPTVWAKNNLVKEGISERRIHVTGNTVVDSLIKVASMHFSFDGDSALLKSFLEKYEKIVLVTAHRRESFGLPFKEMCLAMKEIVESFSGVGIVYPVHPNPNVRETVYGILKGDPKVLLVEPLNYLTFVHLMKSCYLILTDSGGIQEEAPTFKKPVLVMREKTERPEALEAGVAKLVGTKKENIVDEVTKLIKHDDEYKKMATGDNPFGDGKASERIVKFIQEFFNP
jgi:UDP-N-acetylglucosamine 2-epimerase (non-hydrolysing)